MEENLIWTCIYCHINPSAQSSRKCPRCGRKLTPWDLSKAPLERQPEWPSEKDEVKSAVRENENRTDYTKFFDRNDD